MSFKSTEQQAVIDGNDVELPECWSLAVRCWFQIMAFNHIRVLSSDMVLLANRASV